MKTKRAHASCRLRARAGGTLARHRLLLALVLAAVSPEVLSQPDRDGRAAILLFDGVQIIDFAGPYEVFGQAGFNVYTVSATGAGVTTAMDLEVNVDHSFETAPRADILLIPGGHIHDAMVDADTLEFVESMSASAEHVLSVCTGSFVLAATGLLDGKSATTFHRSFQAMSESFTEVEILRDRRWVDTGKLVTSAGLSSGIDAALHVVAQVRGEEAARTVAMNLEYDWSAGDRDGFIRGLQADRHIRYPSQMFPAGTEVHPVTSFGDTRSWRSVFHIVGSLDSEAFVARLRELAAMDEGVRLSGAETSQSVAWRYENGSGAWQLRLTANDADADGGFELVVELSPIG